MFGVAGHRRADDEGRDLGRAQAAVGAAAGDVDVEAAAETARQGRFGAAVCVRLALVLPDQRAEDARRPLGSEHAIVTAVEHGNDIRELQFVRGRRIDVERRAALCILVDTENEFEAPIEAEVDLVVCAESCRDQRILTECQVEVDALVGTAGKRQRELVVTVLGVRRGVDAAVFDQIPQCGLEALLDRVGRHPFAGWRRQREVAQCIGDLAGDVAGLDRDQLGADERDGCAEYIALQARLHGIEITRKASRVDDSEVSRQQHPGLEGLEDQAFATLCSWRWLRVRLPGLPP